MGDEAGADSAAPVPELDKADRAEAARRPDQSQSCPSQRAVPASPGRSAAELDVGWGERPREPDRLSEDDERLLRERPPHWE